MCPQYRQRQTSELNEQGKNDIPVRCQGACSKSRRFLEILQNILISKLSLFYMHFSCQNTGIYSLKKPVNPRKLKVSSTAGRPSQHTLRRLNCSLFYLIGLWKHVQCLIGLRELINSYRLCFASTNQNLSA